MGGIAMRRWNARGVAGLLVVLLALAGQPVHGAEPLKIRIGYQGLPDKILPMVAHRKDIVPHVGTVYEVELLRFNASSEEITALATGDLEIGVLGYSSLGLALENARMDDLRMVGDLYRDGVAGYFSNEFRVLKDSPVQRVEDLQGKVLGANGAGSVVDMAIRYMLRQHGLEATKNYTLVEAPLPNLVPMLLERKIDLSTVGVAYSYEQRVQEQTRILFTERDTFGVSQFALFAARTGFLERNRPALYDFFEDLVRATRWLLEPAHRDDAIRFAANFSKLPAALLSTYYMTARDTYRDPDARPDIAATQHNLQAMRDLGFLKTNIDVARHTDLSFIDEAVKRLR